MTRIPPIQYVPFGSLSLRYSDHSRPPQTTLIMSSSSSSSSEDTATTTTTTATATPTTAPNSSEEAKLSSEISRRDCYYRSPAHGNHWKPRIEINELEIGQELQATVVQELLQAKTGPKLFCEVGIGRYLPRFAKTVEDGDDAGDDAGNDEKLDTTDDSSTAASAESGTSSEDEEQSQQRPQRGDENNNEQLSSGAGKPRRRDWQMVYAMLRLPDRKASVARKRAARLRKKNYFPVYVSCIRPSEGRVEVCLTQEDALAQAEKLAARIPLSQLYVGQIVTGRVTRVTDYGVLVDIGAKRRHALLHIQTVADLWGQYIDKAQGLQTTAGLSRGTRVQLQIARMDFPKKGEIALEFTAQAQEAAAQERAEREAKKQRRQQQYKQQQQQSTTTARNDDGEDGNVVASVSTTATISKEEEEAWESLAANPTPSSPTTTTSQDHGEGDEKEYDEDEYEDDDEYDEDREIEDALGLGYY